MLFSIACAAHPPFRKWSPDKPVKSLEAGHSEYRTARKGPEYRFPVSETDKKDNVLHLSGEAVSSMLVL